MAVIEGWEFPWTRPVLRTEPMSEGEIVREQGGWVLAGGIANSLLGFAFWALAAHLFSSEAVGISGSLVSLSALATSIGILGLDNGLVRFAARVDRPRTLMWRLLLVGGGLSSVVGLALAIAVLGVSNAASGLGSMPLAATLLYSFRGFRPSPAGGFVGRRKRHRALGVLCLIVAAMIIGYDPNGTDRCHSRCRECVERSLDGPPRV